MLVSTDILEKLPLIYQVQLPASASKTTLTTVPTDAKLLPYDCVLCIFYRYPHTPIHQGCCQEILIDLSTLAHQLLANLRKPPAKAVIDLRALAIPFSELTEIVDGKFAYAVDP